MYLGYARNDENTINNRIYNGQVGGIIWLSQSDDAQRKYEYTYDQAGRLANADFNEMSTVWGDVDWNKTRLNFSVGGSGTNNPIDYDLNGNLKKMKQMGYVFGQGIKEVDNLSYSYDNGTNNGIGNKLYKVTDNGTAGTANGQNGDFKGTTNATDYVYDANGNMIVDLNKGISGSVANPGIVYNFLDKAETITMTNGTLKICYDADGNKLQKIFTPSTPPPGGGGAGGVQSNVTSYIGNFIYQETTTSPTTPLLQSGSGTLQYINFEEGRIRVIEPGSITNADATESSTTSGNLTLPVNAGVFDYYLRDYQQNVRMIITEEAHTSIGICTLESATQDPVFGTLDANKITTTPSDWKNNPSSTVSKLSKNNPIGQNALLKVMAGDEISAMVDYYYPPSVGYSNDHNTIAATVVTNLATALAGSAATAGTFLHNNTIASAATSNIPTTTSPVASPLVNVTDPGFDDYDGKPRAFLTILFFDDRMNFISEGSTSLQVSKSGNGYNLPLGAIKAPNNGFVYIYCSNESAQPVYFDNLTVNHTHGRLLEENHYYPFGLKIAALSSQALPSVSEGETKNAYLYNDKELWDEGDLNWYDYGFRNYDPQIGRFTQLDPLTWEYPHYTPFQYAGNEPIANVDRDGLEEAIVTQAVSDIGTTSTFITAHLSQQLPLWAQELSKVHLLAEVTVYSGAGFYANGLAKITSIANFVLPRFEGTLQAAASVPIMALGAATAGIGVGIPIFAFGADVGAAGVNQVIDGQPHKTFTEQGLEGLGYGDGDASAIVNIATIYFSFGGVSVKPTPSLELNTPAVVNEAEIKWPPNDGFDGTPTQTTLPEGTTFDRYGSPRGSYGSPLGTRPEQRSLAPGTTNKPLTKYKVLKPIENVQSGPAAPWFEQPGGGTQYKFPKTIEQLKADKFIEEIK